MQLKTDPRRDTPNSDKKINEICGFDFYNGIKCMTRNVVYGLQTALKSTNLSLKRGHLMYDIKSGSAVPLGSLKQR